MAYKPRHRAFFVAVRTVGAGLLGAACGGFLGLANGVVHAPPEVPGDDLANEWYGLGVLFFMMIEGVVGFLLGAVVAIGVRAGTLRPRAYAYALGGAALGLGIVWLLGQVCRDSEFRGNDGVRLMFGLIAQGFSALIGMAFAARSEPG